MALGDLTEWLDDHTGPNFVWYLKRLSANDTLATGAHQAGPYIPKEAFFHIFPSLHTPERQNPDKRFELRIDSHADVRQVRAIWYNNKFHGGTRNEARLTNFGGAASPLLDPESTGSLTVFAFAIDEAEATVCNVWVCGHAIEEDIIEERTGPIEPGKGKLWTINLNGLFPNIPLPLQSCRLQREEIPATWLTQFPNGWEIIQKTIERRPEHGLPIDKRLLRRRECEFEIYRSVEEAIELPLIQQGFQTVDDFISYAQTILQRRKARSGRSLELHTRTIFEEEGFVAGQHFAHQVISEGGKKPDFLFPSQGAYQNDAFPADRLRMLAVKTTCKDRWRQILNEADRINTKHLLTLQEGVSENQFREMVSEHVQLVVPEPLIERYPEAVRPHLQTLESFIGDIRLLTLEQ